MITPRPCFLPGRLIFVCAALAVLATPAALALRSPRPGEVYKEFTRIMASGSKQWRVTHPNATAVGSPGNSPADFLPNPTLAFSVDDLAGAIRAEAVIDYWGGHPGTTGQQFRFNGNAWIDVPELGSLPRGREECYIQQWNAVVDVPLSDLRPGGNVVEGTAGRQTCFNFGWGQWGWYLLTVRVYYDPAAKSPATAAIRSPAAGAVLGENPTISADASAAAGVERVEFFAYYDGYDTDGDGVYAQYHQSYHRGVSDSEMRVSRHVGTATTAPYAVVWDTNLVQEQPPGSIKLIARVRDAGGLWTVTDEVTGLSLNRSGSVRLFKPQDVPERFWTRAGRRNLTSTVTIPAGVDLSTALSAKLLVRTWNGIDGSAEPGQAHSTRVNNYLVPETYGANHFYSYDELDIPPSRLQNGKNTLRFDSQSTHHGIEILWPGPALVVRFSAATPAFCGDGNRDPGEECDDGNAGDGDGCEADCTVGEVRFLKSPPPGAIYREYTRIMPTGTKEWRVTHPGASAAGSPGNRPADFLPNPSLAFEIDDLDGAQSAEALLDIWGGHVGTTDKRMRLNGNGWLGIPELRTTPTDGQCYTQQLNAVVDVPLAHLTSGPNVLEGTSGGQTCFNFNWGQWGWYSMIMRVYYDPRTKPERPEGSIAWPPAGATFADNPVIVVDADSPAGIRRVEVLAYYEGYDTDGDGEYRDWQHSYHRDKSSNRVEIANHVGTATEAPFEIPWDTALVPDQPPTSIKLVARILDNSGLWYVTEIVDGLTLERNDRSLKLYKPNNVPERFWTRSGRRNLSSRVEIPPEDPLATARKAWLLVRTWNGIDGAAGPGEEHSTRVNGWSAPDYGANHFYSFDVIEVPVGQLKANQNTITVDSASSHHGIEVLWPGPALLVEFAGRLPSCGDGTLNGDEQCDDGNNADDDGCSALCIVESCGDGVTQAGLGEQCDDGNLDDNDACGNDCLSSSCGDGEVTGGEQCDDGNHIDGDGCEADCTLPLTCGDGTLDPSEECDDGNTVDGDGCQANCVEPVCGDGIVDPGEECDDGNALDGDGCQANCRLPVCGDGILDPGQQCDDGNTVDGDGCQGNCLLPACGDGILDPGEDCDDGNALSGDGCQADCALPVCGDGIVDPGEQCDDGNLVSGDGCQANCALPVCGDGVVDPGEQCDDGNADDSDDCDGTCRCVDCLTGITLFWNGEAGGACPSGVCTSQTGYTLDPVREFSAGAGHADLISAGRINAAAALFGEYGFESRTNHDQLTLPVTDGDLLRSEAGSVCLMARRGALAPVNGYRLFLAHSRNAASYLMLDYKGTDGLRLRHRDRDGSVTIVDTGAWSGAATADTLLIQLAYDASSLRVLVDGIQRAAVNGPLEPLGAIEELRLGNGTLNPGHVNFDQVLISEDPGVDCWDLLAGFCQTDPATRCVEAADCGGGACAGVAEDFDQLGASIDQCPDDPEKVVPGACGCGVADDDADLDGIPDCLARDAGIRFFFNGEACLEPSCGNNEGYSLDPRREFSAGDDSATFVSSGRVNAGAALFGDRGFDSRTPFDQMLYEVAGGDLIPPEQGSICLSARRGSIPADAGYRLFTAQSPSARSSLLLSFSGTSNLRFSHRDLNQVTQAIQTGTWKGADTPDTMLIQMAYDASATTGTLRLVVDGVERASTDAALAPLGDIIEFRVGNASANGGTLHFDHVLISERADLDCWDLLAGSCSITGSVRCIDDSDCPGVETCAGVVEDYDQLP